MSYQSRGGGGGDPASQKVQTRQGGLFGGAELIAPPLLPAPRLMPAMAPNRGTRREPRSVLGPSKQPSAPLPQRH